VSDAEALKRNEPKATAWLRRTAEERAICDGMERDEATNLTQHIMNSHGFSAGQYGPNGKPAVFARRKWTQSWKPPKAWTNWPMPPDEVPRRPYRVWDKSVTMNEPWVPGRDLESEVFAHMLKTSRLRWNQLVKQAAKQAAIDAAERVRIMKEAEQKFQKSKRAYRERKLTKEQKQLLDKVPAKEVAEKDTIVFSADDQKSWATARPAVRSILGKFDAVLSALRSSADYGNEGHCETAEH
jgi:hypothetical protein